MTSPADKVRALARRGQTARDEGRYADARRDQEEALAIARGLDDPLLLAHTLRHLGDILQEAGQFKEAEPHYREMLNLYRANTGTPALDFANAIRSVAVHAEAMGEAERARALWSEARERYAALDDLFERLTGRRENPGVAEADRHLARLHAPQARDQAAG